VNQITLTPIGIVHTKASPDEIRRKERPIESVVEVYPEYADGLDGLEEFSHIFVLGYFHSLRPEQKGPLRVKPRRLLQYGLKEDELPTVGVFSLDSPTRPNPIGLSLVPLLRKTKNELTVSGLDYFDGTPVLDIKPYQTSYRVEEYAVPKWHKDLLKKAGGV
jgi:tRNA-Thr(GGU) m(6)t(6)A37 methyltransferase TsaA